MLKSKIHRATITDSDLNYVGSIDIDADLLDAVDIHPYEQVTVVDVNNGARFDTYVIPGERGRGLIKVNGAAARLVHRGDIVIVMSYAQYSETELSTYEPAVAHVNGANAIISVDSRVERLQKETEPNADGRKVIQDPDANNTARVAAEDLG